MASTIPDAAYICQEVRVRILRSTAVVGAATLALMLATAAHAQFGGGMGGGMGGMGRGGMGGSGGMEWQPIKTAPIRHPAA